MTSNTILTSTSVLDALPGHRIGVVGDVILDRYIWGDTSRVSEEAPVPVVQFETEHVVPGGAANVAMNLASLGIEVDLFGFVGNDKEAATLNHLLHSAGIHTHLYPNANCTTTKTRIIARNQQILRLDQEPDLNDSSLRHDTLISEFNKTFKKRAFEALIFEDYAMGTLTQNLLTQILANPALRKTVTILDPHPLHAFEIKGLNLITPNRKEAFLLSRQLPPHDNQSVSPAELKQLASFLHNKWAPQHVLITLGSQGMILFDENLNAKHLPTTEREVFDVSGAGDTVAAVCASVMGAGYAVLDGAKLANIAAGTVIKHLGTVPVNPTELKQALESIS